MGGAAFKRLDNRIFTMIGYRGGMFGSRSAWRRLMAMLLMICGMMWSAAAQAQNCSPAATQGTAPASWQTYCWLNLANYNDTTARSAAGQNLSFTLPDGSTLTFNARVTGTNPAYNAVAAPSWTGSAVGNSAFLGIPGRPVLYSAQAGTSTIAITNIAVTPPAGGGVTVYSFVVADAESSNETEALRISTNGGAWTLLDSVPPISGSTMPPITGVGTTNVTVTGVSGTVGAYIIGSNSPTSVTVQTQSGGLQGVMFAIRFATIRLQTQIFGSRLSTSDQFSFQIASTGTGGTVSSGTTSGSGTGPFSTAPLNMAAGIPITLRVTMAAGSTNALTAYSSILGCTNTLGTTRPALPSNTATTNLNIGQLEFGESLLCTFTLGAPPRLRVRKLLGAGGRRFSTDQFTVRIMSGSTALAVSTTAGTGGTINANTGDTTLTLVNPSQAYTVDEAAAGTTVLGNYTITLACTNATSGTGTVLPTTVGGAITLRPGDQITCTITNTRRAIALLVIEKTSAVISDPVNGTTNPKLIPGAVVEYSITVRNVGTGTVDASSVVVVDVMPSQMAYAVTTPVTFTNGATASGLSFASANVTYSQASGGTTSFTYTPTGTYDGRVTGIRVAPTGTMAAATSGTAQPSFTIRFRAQIE
jgi:uncharacterized repeat protein (TIGR01451 family)